MQIMAVKETPKLPAKSVFVRAIWSRRRHLYVAVLATFVVNLIALATSFFTMQVYDRVIPLGSFSTLAVLCFGVGVALLFDFVLKLARARLLEDAALEIDREVSEFFFKRAQDVRLDERPPSVGTFAAQLRGLEQIRAAMSSATLFAFADLPFALLFIYVVYALGGVIALVLLVSFPVAMVLALFLAKLIREDTKKVQISGFKKNGLLVEALDAAEVVKSNRGESYFLGKWIDLIEKLHAHERPVKNLQAIASSFGGTIQQFAYVALIAWGAMEVYANNITMGALIACSILAGRVNGPLIAQAPQLVLSLTNAKIALGMLDQMMALPVENSDVDEPLVPEKLDGKFELSNVSFTYKGARVPIQVPGLSISPGERVAILGGVGSGKSTLLRLLCGIYTPQEGSVLIDNLDTRHIESDCLHRHVDYLPQDVRLVNGTLKDNLLMGVDDVTDDDLAAAARKTGLDAIIAQHPMGFELPISEGGRGLSGGQRALAGLTRLILREPKIWVMDEPTSHLDDNAENRVLSLLQSELKSNDTLIFVTHKPKLINLADRIVVLANGKIVADQSKSEFLEKLNKNKPKTVSVVN